MYAKENNLPLYYIIIPDITREDCQRMNAVRTSWKNQDYINFYAMQGNVNYLYLANLDKEFKSFDYGVLLYAINKITYGGGTLKLIQNGNFQCTANQYNEAIDKLDYLTNLFPYLKQIKGRRTQMCSFLLMVRLMVQKITAYHEAGHAILFHACETQDPVHQISIIPRGMAGGYTMYKPNEDRSYSSKSEMEEHIVSLLGGRVAEQLVLDDISTGASNDIEQATKLARAMITRYGMSKDFDMVALETVSNQYLGGDTSLTCSPQTAAAIDQEVMATIREAHAKAIEILRENYDKLHELAAYLLEKETITGKEFMKIFININSKIYKKITFCKKIEK